MNFLAPLMLLGVLGVSVPIIIHLIGRQRAKIIRFGAIDFLLGQNKKLARRLRFREILLLALRVAACLALALALSKPLASCRGSGPAIERGPQAAAIIIDNGFTMGLRAGDETLLDRAEARARRILDELGPEAEVAILYTAEGSEPPLELSRDHLRLSTSIRDTRLANRPADTTAALRRAWGLLQSSPHQRKHIYLISAMTATSFPPGEPPWPAAGGPELHVIDAADGAPLANVAVTRVTADKEPTLGARGVRVTAEITNYGPAPVKGLGVTFKIGQRTIARGLVTLGPGEGLEKSFSGALPGDARGADATIEIDADALPADDRRYLRLELRSEVRVLIVDGDPRTVRHDDEAFYLETALRPGDRADSALAVSIVTPDELAGLRLADHDVIFLCNVEAQPAERVAQLQAWVEAGGGLFVSVGDHVDAEAYARTMAPLLPQALASARTIAPPNATAKERDELAEHLALKLESGHPVFSVFGPSGLAALRAARFHRIFLLGPSAGAADGRRVLARFQGGAPALVEARLGKGRVLLFTSTIDRDWTDLPIHQAYLPLVQQAARYLARSPTRTPPAELVVGRTRDVPVAPEDTRVEVTGPRSSKTTYTADRLKGRQSVAFSATTEPGFYHVAAATGADALRARPAADFVVNLDPRGSDVRHVAPADLPASGPVMVAAGADGEKKAPLRRVELWHGLAAALLVMLLAEGVLTRR